MRFPHQAGAQRAAFPLLIASLLTVGVAGCASDLRTPAEPRVVGVGEIAQQNIASSNAILVTSSTELVAALVPANAGRRILLRAGSYDVGQTLVVPDGATLEGEGAMQLDDEQLPTGLRADTRTTLVMVANTPGNVLTLGDRAGVRRLAIEDLVGRAGNTVGIQSRQNGDRVSAALEDIEILNPSIHGVGPQGPTGCGLVVLTLNPNLGAAPGPHVGAIVGARITRTLIRAPAGGAGCGVFAFNFAPQAEVSVTLSDDVVGGGIDANGGVSRPDAVYDSKTVIQSHHNLYREDTPDACLSPGVGWKLNGGSGTPAPLPAPATERNALRFRSEDDRIEGFTIAVQAAGGRRYFAAPIAGLLKGNSAELELLGTTIVTPSCGGVDFLLAGGATTDASTTPVEGNTLRAVIRNVTGSGVRANVFADLLGPSGPLSAGVSGNRIEIVGNSNAFGQTNRAIEPAPSAEFFTGGD